MSKAVVGRDCVGIVSFFVCGFFIDFAKSQVFESLQKIVEKKSILEYISDRTSTTDFTNKINFLVEQITLLLGFQ